MTFSQVVVKKSFDLTDSLKGPQGRHGVPEPPFENPCSSSFICTSVFSVLWELPCLYFVYSGSHLQAVCIFCSSVFPLPKLVELSSISSLDLPKAPAPTKQLGLPLFGNVLHTPGPTWLQTGGRGGVPGGVGVPLCRGLRYRDPLLSQNKPLQTSNLGEDPT